MRLFDNLWLKIFALLTGLLLWFHVATEKEYQYRVTLSVEDVVLGENLTLSGPPPDSVEIAVTASGKQLLRRKWRRLGLKIHASELTVGRHTLSLTPSTVSLVAGENAIQLGEVISPTSCQLTVDYRSEHPVKVQPDLEVIADDGYVVAAISDPEPAEVTLIGARSKVWQVTAIGTEPRRLEKLRDNLTLHLAVQPPQDALMRVEPESVTVTIDVIAAKTRVIDGIPVVVRNKPPASAAVARPNHVRIELSGPPSQVDALDPATVVVWADYQSRDTLGQASIEVSIPPTLRIKNLSVSSVRIVEE